MLRDVSTAWASQRLAGCFNSLQIQPTRFLHQQIFNCTQKEIISQLCTDVGGKCATAKLIHQKSCLTATWKGQWEGQKRSNRSTVLFLSFETRYGHVAQTGLEFDIPSMGLIGRSGTSTPGSHSFSEDKPRVAKSLMLPSSQLTSTQTCYTAPTVYRQIQRVKIPW